jgi:leucyl/phenylalanyl-tRNA--protein transferase
VSKVYFLNDREPAWFPNPSKTNKEGLVAVSETLGVERLVIAYKNGIFPWLKAGEYPLWHWFSPDPRFLLYPKNFRISRSLKKALKEKTFKIQINQNFQTVMESCAAAKRPDQESTWIEDDMIKDYCKLHDLGLAHSIEAHYENKLVGGLYGIFLGRSFFGESMFFKMPEASKVCLAKLIDFAKLHNFDFVDCQVYTEHLKNMGACEVGRTDFLTQLKNSLSKESINLDWNNII